MAATLSSTYTCLNGTSNSSSRTPKRRQSPPKTLTSLRRSPLKLSFCHGNGNNKKKKVEVLALLQAAKCKAGTHNPPIAPNPTGRRWTARPPLPTSGRPFRAMENACASPIRPTPSDESQRPFYRRRTSIETAKCRATRLWNDPDEIFPKPPFSLCPPPADFQEIIGSGIRPLVYNVLSQVLYTRYTL